MYVQRRLHICTFIDLYGVFSLFGTCMYLQTITMDIQTESHFFSITTWQSMRMCLLSQVTYKETLVCQMFQISPLFTGLNQNQHMGACMLNFAYLCFLRQAFYFLGLNKSLALQFLNVFSICFNHDDLVRICFELDTIFIKLFFFFFDDDHGSLKCSGQIIKFQTNCIQFRNGISALLALPTTP